MTSALSQVEQLKGQGWQLQPEASGGVGHGS
jgi:hypothetical protein